MARKLFPYDRFSPGPLQAGGTSAPRQAEMIQAVATEFKATVDDSYALSDHKVSAYKGTNVKKKLGLFIRLCKEGVVRRGDLLCFERVNRLSRMKWSDQVKLWAEILSYGVEIVTCEPRGHYTAKNYDELAVNTPLSIYMNLAHEESKQKSQWIRYAHKVSRERAMENGVPHGQRCPSWLRPISQPHPTNPKRRIVLGWEKILDRVTIIRRMHELAWEKLSNDDIAAQLNSEGVPCWLRAKRWTRDMVWFHLSARSLLGWVVPNPRNYTNERTPPKPYRNYPPILTDAEFERTQLELASRRKTGGRRCIRQFSLFSGLVQTEDDRPLYIAYSIGYGNKRHPYLAPRPQTLRVPYQPLEDAFLDLLRQLKPADIDGSLRPDEWSERTLALQDRSAKLHAALDDIDRQLAELPPERWPERAVSRMAALEDEIRTTKFALDQAKLYGSTSGRVEALTDTQSIVTYVRGLSVPKERRAAMERIKARLPILLDRITVAESGKRGRSKWVHLRVSYKGGKVDYYNLRVRKPLPAAAKFCRDW